MMDWETMLGMNPFHQQPQEEELEDDNEDFYGENEETQAGAAAEADGDAGDLLDTLMPKEPEAAAKVQWQNAPMPKSEVAATSAADRKAENQRQADLLRARLLAKRNNALQKPLPPRLGTPSNTPIVPSQPAVIPAQPKPAVETKHDVFHFAGDGVVVPSEVIKPSNGTLDLDALIAEGKQAAEAKTKKETAAQTSGHALEPIPVSISPFNPKVAPELVETPKALAQSVPVQIHQGGATVEKVQHSQLLTDVYYTDLAVWLEYTGYHDVEYRSAKLQKHKARKALEAEAAKIQQQLDRLKREEETEMQALRASLAHPVSTPETAPPLPSTMPSGDAATPATAANGLANGTKRPHSPTPAERSTKRFEEPPANGFRIRGANDSPTSPHELERRISYPDVRRRSLDATKSRDTSLERRQTYYKRDGERPGARPYDAYEPGRDGRPLPPREYNGGRGGAGYRGRGGGGGMHGREYGLPYGGEQALPARRSARSGRP
ncbi:hypothetical protein LTR54_009100 [Friedmanniomyces endolithicus]|nr:hypothetical protein LTS00_001124 [Friedmanniomyces endolithicus]KAK0314361.1 hypothetical protein LTR01_001184 [Friedmanniomyces endolithicus]KAK0830802.1 hypothetical protein LTR73_003188 [Friedmanniomyces endolithicus]KAK0999356.1 hypothetical protein LTR54_009100 [Friedmanniomyces endolithicus]